MKKRKIADHSSENFKNNPFKSLKSDIPKLAPAGKRSAPAREKKNMSNEDDASLFFRAIEGARRMGDGLEPAAAQVHSRVAQKPDSATQEDKQLFLQAMQKIGATFHDEIPEMENEGTEHRSSTSRMRQLKRGTIRISQELDLHGFLKDEALKRIEHFIADAFRRGNKAVLVITGKGINSPEGPVLQGAVASWLRKQGKAMVAEFSPAPRELGGEGAFVVFLKKK